MGSLEFEMFIDLGSKRNGGISTTFIDGKGEASTSWWSSPPDNLDHVDKTYLKGRFPNIQTERHVQFIQKEFKAQLKNFENYEGSKFRKLETEEDVWCTLAVSSIGTHNMKFNTPLSKEEAVRAGKEYCSSAGMRYIGTYLPHQIKEAEKEERKKMKV